MFDPTTQRPSQLRGLVADGMETTEEHVSEERLLKEVPEPDLPFPARLSLVVLGAGR